MDIDFSQLQVGGTVVDFQQVEDDGNPLTPPSWLLFLLVGPQLEQMVKLVVVRADGSFCHDEAPFNPRDTYGAFAGLSVTPVDGRHMLKVIDSNPFVPAGRARVRSLDRIACR
jgi:hypothetical protein